MPTDQALSPMTALFADQPFWTTLAGRRSRQQRRIHRPPTSLPPKNDGLKNVRG